MEAEGERTTKENTEHERGRRNEEKQKEETIRNSILIARFIFSFLRLTSS
jgi:hypothetical protein